MTECGYDSNWGGICKEPRVEGLEVCAKHAGVKCVVCDVQAVLNCYHHLGNWECGQPLCKAHQYLHHPDSNAFDQWYKGTGRKLGAPESTSMWYAFMWGWNARNKGAFPAMEAAWAVDSKTAGGRERIKNDGAEVVLDAYRAGWDASDKHERSTR